MSVLTKEQIQKLTPEAQEAFASLTLAEANRRAQLLEKTKRSAWQTWITSLIPAAMVFVFLVWRGWTIPESERLVLLAVIVLLFGTTQWQVRTINRRLDSLIELLEADLRSRRAEPSAGGNAASRRASA